jgi:hypothetical protein
VCGLSLSRRRRRQETAQYDFIRFRSPVNDLRRGLPHRPRRPPARRHLRPPALAATERVSVSYWETADGPDPRSAASRARPAGRRASTHSGTTTTARPAPSASPTNANMRTANSSAGGPGRTGAATAGSATAVSSTSRRSSSGSADDSPQSRNTHRLEPLFGFRRRGPRSSSAAPLRISAVLEAVYVDGRRIPLLFVQPPPDWGRPLTGGLKCSSSSHTH